MNVGLLHVSGERRGRKPLGKGDQGLCISVNVRLQMVLDWESRLKV